MLSLIHFTQIRKLFCSHLRRVCEQQMAGSSLRCLLVVFAVAACALSSRIAAAAPAGSGGLTAGFTRVNLRESQFIVQKPWNVRLDQRYEFAGGVRRMWVFDTDKTTSATHPGGARTEIKINVNAQSHCASP